MEEILKPFLAGEAATAWLADEIEFEGLSTKALYAINIISHLLKDQVKNGTEQTDPLFKRVPPQTLRGLSEGGRAHVAASLLCRGNDRPDQLHSPNRGGEETELLLNWDFQLKLIELWAKTDGCWYENADSILSETHKFVGSGAESRVYFDGKYVLKTVGTIFGPQEALLDRFAISNSLFPETAVRIIGFGKNQDGEFCAVLRQPFVQGQYVESELVADILSEDFRIVNDGRENKLVTDELILGDLHDRNVLVSKNGNFFVIDCNTYLNTPEKNLGGKWNIPPLEADGYDVDLIEDALEQLAPFSLSRKSLAVRMVQDTCDPASVFEQLDLAGRYDGLVTIRNATDIVRVSVRTDPDNADRVLCSSQRSIRAMLFGLDLSNFGLKSGQDALEKKMLAELSCGKGVWINRNFFAFDPVLGRIAPATPFKLALRRKISESKKSESVQEECKSIRRGGPSLC